MWGQSSKKRPEHELHQHLYFPAHFSARPRAVKEMFSRIWKKRKTSEFGFQLKNPQKRYVPPRRSTYGQSTNGNRLFDFSCQTISLTCVLPQNRNRLNLTTLRQSDVSFFFSFSEKCLYRLWFVSCSFEWSALESSDPGASDGSSNVGIWLNGANLMCFEVLWLARNWVWKLITTKAAFFVNLDIDAKKRSYHCFGRKIGDSYNFLVWEVRDVIFY